MPAQVPQATFLPLPPNLDLEKLVDETPNFQYVTRISFDMIEAQGADLFEKLVLLHVILGGKPLVIEGFQHSLPPELFSAAWLREKYGSKFEKARNLLKQSDMDISMSHYLKHMSRLTDQWTEDNYQDASRQRLYLKDIDCPDEWHSHLKDVLPPNVFYLNESTVNGVESTGRKAAGTPSKRIAPAGDLMSSLPPPMRAENLMCYIGHEGTFTPAHREMCASLGQNIMVETSGDGLDPWGSREKPGSSIWFMTETKDRFLVSEYWLSILGHDIEVEAHFAQINAWKHAPFTTYIVEQKAGDFILIPPLAPHQVWNRGTRTMKVAWNRTTVETLEMALDEALPRARMVCRDQQYKNKAIIYFTLTKYANLLHRIDEHRDSGWSAAALAALDSDRKVRQLRKDFRRLFKLYTDILLSEMCSADLPKEKHVQFIPFDGNVTCGYCRCNIFNRFLTCPSCVKEMGEEDAYDICMECYAMGRSCACISKLTWVEQFPWKKLVADYEDWRVRVIQMDGEVNQDSPVSLDIAVRRLGRKTLAHVCQEQLKLRPWRDIKKRPHGQRGEHQAEDEEEEETPNDNEDEEDYGKRRGSRKRKRRSKKADKNNSNCHICKHRELSWKLARCRCGTAYCYGTLFRGFDMMPLQVMENPEWKCPKCLKICSCGQCRNNPQMRSYRPVGTLVGHDTRRVADPRSVESLVDFSRSNFNWIKQVEEQDNEVAQPYETPRLRRLREEAEREKAKEVMLNGAFAEEDELFVRPAHGTTQNVRPHPNLGSSPRIAVDPNLESLMDAVLDEPKQASSKSWSPAQNYDDGGAGLGALERDPHGFISMAGLDTPFRSDDQSSSEHHVAPVAKMGASPSLRPRVGALRPVASSSSQVQTSLREPTLRSLAQSALDADLEQTRAMRQKTLDKATENNSYMMARARLDGLQKLVSVPLPKEPRHSPAEQYASLPDQDHQQSNPDAESAVSKSPSPKDLVVSDFLPKKGPARTRKAARPAPSKSVGSEPTAKAIGSPRAGRGRRRASSAVGRASPARAATSHEVEESIEVRPLENGTEGPPASVPLENPRRTSSRGQRARTKEAPAVDEQSPKPRTAPTRGKKKVSFSAQDDADDPMADVDDIAKESFVEVDDNYEPISRPSSMAKRKPSVPITSTKKAPPRRNDAKVKPVRTAEADHSDAESTPESSESEHESTPKKKAARGALRGSLAASSTVDAPVNSSSRASDQSTPKSPPAKRLKVVGMTKSSNIAAPQPTPDGGGGGGGGGELRSMFSRLGMAGKKVKIVSQKNATAPSGRVSSARKQGGAR